MLQRTDLPTTTTTFGLQAYFLTLRTDTTTGSTFQLKKLNVIRGKDHIQENVQVENYGHQWITINIMCALQCSYTHLITRHYSVKNVCVCVLFSLKSEFSCT